MADEYDEPGDGGSLFSRGPAGGHVKPVEAPAQARRAADQSARGLTEEQVQAAIARNMVERHALLIAEQITLAAARHPVLMRNALASVFDLRGFEADAQAVAASVAFLRQTAEQTQRQLMDIRAEVDTLRAATRKMTEECWALLDKLEQAERRQATTCGGQHRSPPPAE